MRELGFGRDLEYDSVEIIRDGDLARESGLGCDVISEVEHIDFVI